MRLNIRHYRTANTWPPVGAPNNFPKLCLFDNDRCLNHLRRTRHVVWQLGINYVSSIQHLHCEHITKRFPERVEQPAQPRRLSRRDLSPDLTERAAGK